MKVKIEKIERKYYTGIQNIITEIYNIIVIKQIIILSYYDVSGDDDDDETL